jgi:integrase
MFRFLAATGLRWSELAALTWRDLKLNGSEPHVRVTRALVRGKIHPPKSRHGKRNVPLDASLVRELRRHRGKAGDDALVFTSEAGTQMHHSNVFSRVLRPVAEEVGAPWAGFHTSRHTCASILFANGRNAVQVQRWLGHHSAAFTLATYVHLMGGELGEPMNLDRELLLGATNGATSHIEMAQGKYPPQPLNLAFLSGNINQRKPAQAARSGS